MGLIVIVPYAIWLEFMLKRTNNTNFPQYSLLSKVVPDHKATQAFFLEDYIQN